MPILRALILSRCGLGARPGRFPCDSGHKQSGVARLGLYPSLRSKLPCAPILRASAHIQLLKKWGYSQLRFVSDVNIGQRVKTLPYAAQTLSRCGSGDPHLVMSRCGLGARPGRFPCDSGHKQPGVARLGLYPSLRSKLPCAPILRASSYLRMPSLAMIAR